MATGYSNYTATRESGEYWLGTVPRQWEVIQSRRLFAQRKEQVKAGDQQLSATQDYGVIPQKEFESLAGRKVVQLLLNLDKRKHVELNDFVISMRSFQGGLERAWSSGCIRSSYVILKPQPGVVPGFFGYLFKSTAYIQALQSTSNFIRDGQDLNFGNFTKVNLPVVPVLEQTQIAKFLDYETARIDALIEKQQQLIALLKEKRQAVISHAVTKGLNPNAPMRDSGVEWLGQVPAHWETLNLNRIVTTFVDYRGRTPAKTDEGRPLVTAGAVRNGIIDLARSPQFVSEETYHELRQRGLPSHGDILFTSEAPLGEIAVVENTEFACAQRIIMFKLDRERMDPTFLWLYLRSNSGQDEVKTKASGSTAEGIRADRLRRCRIPVPPLKEQAVIGSHVARELSGFDELLKMAADQNELLQERRTALISAAVTGKIDVRGWQPPDNSEAA